MYGWPFLRNILSWATPISPEPDPFVMRIAWLMPPIGHPETPTVSMVPPPPLHLKVALSWVPSPASG